MKYKIVLLSLVFPLFTMGQQRIQDSLAAAVISDLKDSWNLGINDDPNQPLNIRVYNKFKSLFDSTATVDDEFNVTYKYDEDLKKSAYVVDSGKAFDVYAHDVALQVNRMTIDSAGTEKLISSNEREYVYEISRKVTAFKYRDYVLEDAATYFNRQIENRKIEFTGNEAAEREKILSNALYNRTDALYRFQSYATLKITIRFINDSLPKISKIEATEITPVTYTNDKDQDGILDNEEQDSIAAVTHGDFTAKGYPDWDFDGISDHVDGCKEIFGTARNRGCPAEYFNNNFSIYGFTGLMINNCNIVLPEPDQFGYSNVDVLQSQKGSFKNPEFGSTISAIFGADFSYYFGSKAKHFGISLGVNYTSYNATYTVKEPVITTFKSNDGVNDYRRRIMIRTGSEEVLNYHVLNVPLLFKYRTKLGTREKWSLEAGGGPSYVYFNNSSEYNVNLDFEGLYQVDTISRNRIAWYDYFDEGSTWNVLLTADDINNQSLMPGVEWAFIGLDSSGYDFKSNKNSSGKDKKATRFSIALNLNCDLSFKVNDFMDVKFGLGFMVAPALKGASDYKPMDKTTDEYNSLYRSKIKSTYTSYGLRAGIVIVLDKLDKKLGIQ